MKEEYQDDRKANIEKAQRQGMFLGATPDLFAKAWQLRHNTTIPERILWARLSRNQLGVKFRRQHPIHSFIADFYCHTHKLVVELDGPHHETPGNRSYDARRTQMLNDFGIRVLRFNNEEVLNNIEGVLTTIRSFLPLT